MRRVSFQYSICVQRNRRAFKLGMNLVHRLLVAPQRQWKLSQTRLQSHLSWSSMEVRQTSLGIVRHVRMNVACGACWSMISHRSFSRHVVRFGCGAIGRHGQLRHVEWGFQVCYNDTVCGWLMPTETSYYYYYQVHNRITPLLPQFQCDQCLHAAWSLWVPSDCVFTVSYVIVVWSLDVQYSQLVLSGTLCICRLNGWIQLLLHHISGMAIEVRWRLVKKELVMSRSPLL